MTQNRLRSKVLWVAVVAVVVGVVTRYIPNVSTDVKFIADAVITLLTLFGVLNDPTSKDKF